MTSFKKIAKNEKLWRSGYMAFYDYLISLDGHSSDDVINAFFSEDNYSIDDENALGRPFKIDQINSGDFKRYTREELFDYLDNFASPKGWSNPNEIKEQLDYFKSLTIHSKNNFFFFLSPDMFDFIEEKKVVITAMGYVYYFLIIWIKENNMMVCQMCMD